MLLDLAGVSEGMTVLDLACGAGAQSLEAARRVGPEGKVVASDISAEMLDFVAANALAAGLKNIETLRSAAEDLADRGDRFDAAISRLGLMLFASPGTALAAVQQVLRNAVKWAHSPGAPPWLGIEEAPNVPIEEAPEKIALKGPAIHKPGEEGFK